jgi:hypothetical protein
MTCMCQRVTGKPQQKCIFTCTYACIVDNYNKLQRFSTYKPGFLGGKKDSEDIWYFNRSLVEQ